MGGGEGAARGTGEARHGHARTHHWTGGPQRTLAACARHQWCSGGATQTKSRRRRRRGNCRPAVVFSLVQQDLRRMRFKRGRARGTAPRLHHRDIRYHAVHSVEARPGTLWLDGARLQDGSTAARDPNSL